MYLVLRGTLKGHRSEEKVSDDWVVDEITQRTWVDKMGDHTPHEVDIIYPSLG